MPTQLAPAAHSFTAQCLEKLSAPDPGEPDDAQRAPFLDPWLGPIELTHFSHLDLYRDLPLVVGSLRLLQPSADAFVRRNLFSITFGPGHSEARRRLIAFAEGIERYAGFTAQPDVVGARASELGAHALLPPTAAGYADQMIDWAFAYNWTKEETRLLPQDAFAIGRARTPGTFCVLDEPFSSGFAAHRSLTLALQRALYELIERDALLLAWYLQLPLTELQWSSDEPLTNEMNAYLTAHEIELRHFDLRVDFDLPCMLTVARTARDYGPWRAGGVIVAASAGPSWERVRAHALQELLGHFSVYGVVAPDGDKHLDPGSGEERRWWPAFAQYLSPREDRPFAFLDSRSKAPFPAEPPAPDLRREFQQRGLSVFVRPLGMSDVQRSGLQVARAYVPELLRLTPTRAEIDFDAPRFAAMRKKWRARSPLNPLPHPIT